MKVQLVVFENGWKRAPLDLVPSLPPGLSGARVKLERRFVVVQRGEDLTVALGPEVGSGFNYYHRDIAAHMGINQQTAGEAGPVAGGGTLTVETNNEYATATFSKSSGDYGVFSADLMKPEVLQQIADQVGIDCVVKRHVRAEPKDGNDV